MAESRINDPTSWRFSLDVGDESIPYRLLEGYPRGRFGDGDARITEQYVIEASNLTKFALAIFPISLYDGTQLFISEHFRYGPLTGLIARSMTFEPFTPGKPCDPFGTDDIDDDATNKTYDDLLRITVEFGPPEFGGRSPANPPFDGSDPRTFLEVDCTANGEIIVNQGGSMKFADEVEVDELGVLLEGVEGDLVHDPFISGPITIPWVEWTVSWPILPRVFLQDVQVDVMRQHLGHVNQNAMPLLFNAKPQTVMFMGWRIRRTWDWRANVPGLPAGLEIPEPHTLEQVFTEKHVDIGAQQNGQRIIAGHNHAWKNGFGWKRLLRSDRTPLYTVSDLNGLFNLVNA